MKKRLFSGIQPSGEIHIGNYLGALKNWVKLMPEYEAIYCVVDYHALTVPQDPAILRERILTTATMLLAMGLDPEKCSLFVQSHVPEHTELSWLLGTVIHIGHLERMTQFKDKCKQHPEDISVGLFTYPVLQTADIALYKAEAVPVGEDQLQHLELAREVVRRFNSRFGDIFPEPQAKVTSAARIMGLDGKAKMSKSMNNTIGLSDTPAEIEGKLKPAITDVNRKRRTDPGNPDICNIYSLHKHFSTPEIISEVDRECRVAGIGCIDCKMKLAKGMIAELSPIRERFSELSARPQDVKAALEKGAEHCRAIAKATIEEVRIAVGVR